MREVRVYYNGDVWVVDLLEHLRVKHVVRVRDEAKLGDVIASWIVSRLVRG